MKLLIDVNLSSQRIDFLKLHELPSTYWIEVDECDAPGIEIFKYAIANDFVIFTHDLDFGTILSMQKSSKLSLVQLRTSDTLPTKIGEKVVLAVQRFIKELESGCILVIDIKKDKVRLLPI